MKRTKRFLSVAVASMLTVFTLISYLPAKTASAAVVVPKIQFASPPVTQYTAGDRVNFNINAPNYGGRVQYRVVLWNDSEKTYYDLWNSSNGYPNRYYTKWQPYGNNIFTLGWIIFDPGSYRITVYAKRAGISNEKTALKGLNCDSYMESVAFVVKSKEAAVESILPLSDVTVMQGATPTLPTKVKAAMSDGLEKEFSVTWGTVNTSNPGTYTIEGTVAGTTKKAYIKVNVTAQTAINVYSVVSVSNYLVNVTLRDAVSTTPDASKFSIKTYNSNTIVPIQSVSLSADKKVVSLTTGYMATNSWYTLTVNNSNINFIANQGTASGITLSALNRDVAVGGTVYASVTKSPSDVILTYTSNNTNIATVNQTTGLITGIYPGIATITVYGNKTGYAQVTTTFTVTVGGQYGMYINAEDMVIGVGQQQYPVITKNPTDLTLSYYSNNTSVATVNSSTGLVTGVRAGTATITVTGYKYGYSNVTDTFIVTVRNQGITISATPARLYESTNNDGSLTSGVIDVALTGSTFIDWGNEDYYVTVNNLPSGMDYTVTQLNYYTMRVTITGRATPHRNIDDRDIWITIAEEIVNGATYDLTSNYITLDFYDAAITPAAPTGPIVNDYTNTFGWTDVPGYSGASYYEYSKNSGASWTACTANPQSIGDVSLLAGAVQVRVKADSASGRAAGAVLVSDKAFTQGTVSDTIKPVLRNLTMAFDSGAPVYTGPTNGVDLYTASVQKGRTLMGMEINVTDEHLNMNNVNVYTLNEQGQQTSLWGVLRWSTGDIWKLNMAGDPKTFNTVGLLRLGATFSDLQGNSIVAKINIDVFDQQIVGLNDVTATVEQYAPYTMPPTVTALMSDGTTKQVAVTWNPASIDTTVAGTFEALGTVAGYATKAKLTLTVTPVTIQNINDMTGTIVEGLPYPMPAKVAAQMSNGNIMLVDVVWSPLTIDTSAPGRKIAYGTVAGYARKVKLTVTITAATIISIEDITGTVVVGGTFVMPTQVAALMSNGQIKMVNVTWDPLTIDTSTVGQQTAVGTVVGYDGTVTLTVTVTAATPTGK